MPLKTVVIVGRPNVGKSTLFNRLVGKRQALVDNTPGVTRDRREGEARLGTLAFCAVDTAGLDDAGEDDLARGMRQQTAYALSEADVVMMMIDARVGITALDQHFADRIRRGGKPTLLIANKCESAAGDSGIIEAFRLGLGDPVAVSAEHGDGMGELFDALQKHLGEDGSVDNRPANDGIADDPAPDDAAPDDTAGDAAGDVDPGPLRLAIVGRPNVGKSTLGNRLLGSDRLIVGPEPGITRDAIAVDWLYEGHPVMLFDTAGLRRRTRVTGKIEKLSAADTKRAIRFAHVVILTLDSTLGLEKQDLTIGREILEEGRCLVLAANKWDKIRDRKARLADLADRTATSLSQVKGVPLVPVSAMTGANIDCLMEAVFSVHEIWNRRIPTSPLNRWLESMVEAHPPPVEKGRRVRLRYATQIGTRPPSFALWASRPLADNYIRYLENGLRERFDLAGVPLRINIRKGDNPYARKRAGR